MERTHRIEIYGAATGATESAYGRPLAGWSSTPIAIEEVNLQPLGGNVRQVAAGREVDATWQGFGRQDIPLQQDMGVVVTHVLTSRGMEAPPANHPRKFRVTSVAFEGQGWDTAFLLNDTSEPIP